MKASDPYRSVLAVPDARRLIGASAASQLGDWLYNAALLGYVYSATGSAGWVGAATIVRLLPYVLLGPIGGAIADRYPKRTVLLAGALVRLLLMVALAGVVATDGPVALVIGLTALASAAGSAERPAAVALLPRLVGAARLGPANALLHTAQDLGVVVGPAIGALLLAVTPDYVPFLANAATFAVAALLVATMRRHTTPTGEHAGALAHLTHGLRTARTTPFVVPLFVVVGVVEFTYGAQTVQLVVYAKQSLGLGAGGYGLLLAAAGLGGLLSAVATGRLSTSRTVSLVVVSTALLCCLTQLVYAGVDVLALALVATVAGGAGLVACEVVAETVLARIVPTDTLGRLVGLFDSTSVGAMVAGAAIAPLLLAWTSLRASLLILGVACVVITLGCRVALRGLDAVSSARLDALAERLAVLQGLPVTTGVPQLVLEQLASAGELVSMPPGVDVVVQGAPARAFYAVVDGRVVVHRDGQVRVHLGRGDNFGERGLLDNAPRNATVTTEVETTLLRIDGDALIDALQEAPSFKPALDISSTAPGVQVPAEEETPLADLRPS